MCKGPSQSPVGFGRRVHVEEDSAVLIVYGAHSHVRQESSSVQAVAVHQRLVGLRFLLVLILYSFCFRFCPAPRKNI